MYRMPKQGDTVAYILPSGIHTCESRAAMVTQIFDSRVNLTVFLDQPADAPECHEFIPFARVWSADYDTNGNLGTWHFID